MRISYWSSDVCSSDLGSASSRHRQKCWDWRQTGPVAKAHVVNWRMDGGYRHVDRTDRAGGEKPRLCSCAREVVRWRGRPHITDYGGAVGDTAAHYRSEEHTSELQSLMRNSYAVF